MQIKDGLTAQTCVKAKIDLIECTLYPVKNIERLYLLGFEYFYANILFLNPN